MDFVKQDLKKVLLQKPAFDEDHMITIMYNLLCALKFLHSANIIHRDIKPANILISSKCEITICDFGLARSMPKKTQTEENFYQKLKDIKTEYGS